MNSIAIIERKKLFNASCIALVTTSMTFAIRADLIGELGEQFHFNKAQTGLVAGTAFWGFTLTTIVGGLICDLVGTKRLLLGAFLGHLAGTILTVWAQGFWSLFFSTLLIGMANGLVEAACNPLVATLYPESKTKKLNQFHVWFPGGIVIGGLIAFGLKKVGAGWQLENSIILVPTVIYGIMFIRKAIPENERVMKGVSYKDMLKECLRPLFLLMIFCMLISAATELGTNQWITDLLANVGVPAILILVFISGIMVLGRSFAGFFESKLSTTGMLLFSAVFSSLGLLLLGYLEGWEAFLAAAIFAIGICFFWPTMLGFVSEYMPKSGALGLGIMGGMGMLSVAFVLPFIGMLYDYQTELYLPAGMSLEDMTVAMNGAGQYSTELNTARLAGGADTLKYVAILPAVLSLIFLALFLNRRRLRKP